MKRFNLKNSIIILLLTVLSGCASSGNIQYPVQLKKGKINAEVYIRDFPKPRIEYPVGLIESAVFKGKSEEHVTKVYNSIVNGKLRNNLLNKFKAKLPEVSDRIKFIIKNNAMEGYILPSKAVPSKNEKDKKNAKNIEDAFKQIDKSIDFEKLKKQIETDYLFIIMVTSWGYLAGDNRNSKHCVMTCSGMLYDVNTGTRIWQVNEVKTERYGGLFFSHTDVNEKNTGEFLDSMMDSIINEFISDLKS